MENPAIFSIVSPPQLTTSISFYILRGFIITYENGKYQEIHSGCKSIPAASQRWTGRAWKAQRPMPSSSLSCKSYLRGGILRGGMLPLPLFCEMHYKRLESRMALLPMSLSQRIAGLNMANKRNTIGLESSLFSSLCPEPEGSWES